MKKYLKYFIFYFCLINLTESTDYFDLMNTNDQRIRKHECELISGECTDQDYKFTSSVTKLPDGSIFFNSQKVADETIRSFELVMPCSNYLKLFLCATYKPSCYEEAALIIQPCKSMCEHVYRRCNPLMKKFKLKWNRELNCSRFQEDNSDSCMKDTGYTKDYPSFDPYEYEKKMDFLYERISYSINKTTRKQSKATTTKPKPKELKYFQAHFDKYICLNRNKLLKNRSFSVRECNLKCYANVLFTSNDKITTRRFTLTLSALCLVSSCFTLLFYLVNTNKYEYPNIILMFMSFCYGIYSLIHLVSLAAGRNLTSCEEIKRESNLEYVYLTNDSDNIYCLAIFLLLYYFKMVSIIWWLTLVISWNLIVQFNLRSKKVSKFSIKYIHLFVWMLPGVQTALVFLNQNASMSELTGLCSFNDLDNKSLLNYVILPTSIYVAVGLLLIILGFVKISLNSKLVLFECKKYLIKIGLTAFLFLIPFLVIIGCELYEYFNINLWFSLPKLVELNLKLSENESFNFKLRNYTKTAGSEQPKTPVFVTKIFMQFLNSFLILFQISLNSKTDKLCFFARKTKKLNDETFSDSSRSNRDHSYQFYPVGAPPVPPPPPTLPSHVKFQNKFDCPCKLTQLKSNEYNYSNQSDIHHYCTPHILLQSEQSNTISAKKKLSTFLTQPDSVL